MTKEDAVYADWLDLLGSDEISDKNEAITADLKAMRERAEASRDPICVCTHPLSEPRKILVRCATCGRRLA